MSESAEIAEDKTPPNAPRRSRMTPKRAKALRNNVKARQARYLRSMARNLDPTKACKYAGVDRATVYRWREVDPEFVERLQLLYEFSTDNVEGAVYRRAMKMSTGDARLWLQARRRDVYGDRLDINLFFKDPRVDGILSAFAQIIFDFVPKELQESAITRLATLRRISGPALRQAGTAIAELPDSPDSETGA